MTNETWVRAARKRAVNKHPDAVASRAVSKPASRASMVNTVVKRDHKACKMTTNSPLALRNSPVDRIVAVRIANL